MHDTIDERLTELGGSLEAAAGVRSPMLVRSRGEQIRVAHRRRMAAVTAVSAAVAVLGVGSLVALGTTGGHHRAPVNPGTAGPSSTSSTGAAPAPGATSAAPAKPIAVVDLKRDEMTVYDGNGQVAKTVAVTGGSTEHPSPVGVFTITAKQNEMKISSTAAGMAGSQSSDSYDIPVHWVITLNGGPSLYAAPWASDSLGKRNETHGDIGMSPESAQWLYDHVKIGDLVQIQ